MINVCKLLGLGSEETLSGDFRQHAASALMHPVTLAALCVLLLNDLLFKVLWPGAWVPGKLSDLAWMMFAPPVLAYILSFATLGSLQAQRAAFLTAYMGLPLLYAAFNTFESVHDAVLGILGLFGGDGSRSPLDPTDSLVIPFAMASALWVWLRPPLPSQSIRTRLALLAAIAAALASVATSYSTDRGITSIGRTSSGTIGANVRTDYPTSSGLYESFDGGLTWTKTSEDYVTLERQDWSELEVKTPSGDVFIVDGKDPQIVKERFGTSGFREMIYSYEYLLSSGNRWKQALDNREVQDRVITTRALDLFYDEQSGNLIVAMGLQGVVVVAPDGMATRVAVGRYSPSDFSFVNKVRTYFGSLLLWETAMYTGVAFLLAFSFAALGLVGPASSTSPRWCFASAAAISAILAIFLGVYPHVLEEPWASDGGIELVGNLALLLSGLGLFPLLLAIAGLVLTRSSLRQLLTVVAATIGMLALIVVGALVLFETGTGIANLAAVALVGLATLGLWAYRKPTQT